MRAVAVVIPARDEETALPAALTAVDVAARAVDCHFVAVVVCDSCADRTADVAAAHGVHVVEATIGCAGGARRLGVSTAASLLPAGMSADELWVASTDADSIVRADWLSTHLRAAADGWDAYAGEVCVPDWSGWSTDLPGAYQRRYRRHGRRPPIHGANLGVRLDAYQAVGGFRSMPCGEDVELVDRLTSAGYRVLASADAPVHTSARRMARAAGGFSSYLQALELEIVGDLGGTLRPT